MVFDLFGKYYPCQKGSVIRLLSRKKECTHTYVAYIHLHQWTAPKTWLPRSLGHQASGPTSWPSPNLRSQCGCRKWEHQIEHIEVTMLPIPATKSAQTLLDSWATCETGRTWQVWCSFTKSQVFDNLMMQWWVFVVFHECHVQSGKAPHNPEASWSHWPALSNCSWSLSACLRQIKDLSITAGLFLWIAKTYLIDVHPKSQNPTSFAFSGCKALTSSLPQKGFWNILYEDAEYPGEVLTELTSSQV